MDRRIAGFHQDELGDWVAELDCGHTQHVRHNPPWQLRPWPQHARAPAHHACTAQNAIAVPNNPQSENEASSRVPATDDE